MYGTLRYVLALLVAFGHVQFRFQGEWNWTGTYAVFGFYVLSGYLMTRVLHATYGYSPKGIARYAANRFLRIYPVYWAAVAITLLVLAWVPDLAGGARPLVHMPESLPEFIRSFAILGIHRDYSPRIVPVAWSLHVELCFYGLLALGVSRSRWAARAWLVASLAWTAWAVSQEVPFGDRYSTVVAASLPFSLGAAVYFWKRSLPRWVLPVSTLLFAGNTLGAVALWGDPYGLPGFYLSLLLVVVMVAGLRDVQPDEHLARWDRRLGDLSYPIFLFHSQVGYLFGWLRWADDGTFGLFLLSLPAIHLAAAVLHAGVEAPIEALRSRIRSRARASRAAGGASAGRTRQQVPVRSSGE